MRTKRVFALTSVALGSLLGVGGLPAGAQHQHPQPAGRAPEASAVAPREQELKVGKSDDVSFTKQVRVGEVTLTPGKYRLQHRVEGADHFVHFEALATTTPSAQKTATGMAVPAGEAGEVKCRLEPLRANVHDTTLHLLNEEGGQRLTKVLIRGENVAHGF
jgi:hypothetical protein